jgi:hypothetical protein
LALKLLAFSSLRFWDSKMGPLVVSKLALNGCIYRRLIGFGSKDIVARCGLWKFDLGEIVAYGGTGGFLAA